MGVEDQNQHHSHVRQHKDVQILTRHFLQNNIFNFWQDVMTKRTVVDLYRTSLQRLSRSNGGHAKHLSRHRLRLRTRHGTSSDMFYTDAVEPGPDITTAVMELRDAHYYGVCEFTIHGLHNTESGLLEEEGEED